MNSCRLPILGLILLSLLGCSWAEIKNGTKFPLMNTVIVYKQSDGKVGLRALNDASSEGDTSEVLGYIITWSPEFNGAFVGTDGKGCVQPASYVNTKSGEVGIPAQLIAEVASGEVKGSYSEAITPLMAVSQQQTYMSIGMYGLCQLVAVGGIAQGDATEIAETLIEEAAEVSDFLSSSQDHKQEQPALRLVPRPDPGT